MIAFRFLSPPPALRGIAVAGPAHEVDADGDDWVARCGERWSRRGPGGVYPDHYAGERCAGCKAAA